MIVIAREDIEHALNKIELIPVMESAFKAYSRGEAVVPPVGELIFDQPPGDVHIKYGYLKNDDFYVIKIASGFYNNPELGLPSNNGLMLLFKQRTGEAVALLCDEGHLTAIRTAVAGAIAAKYLAPNLVHRIGIAGTGVQARLQLQYLAPVTSCRQVLVWGRNNASCEDYKRTAASLGFDAEITTNPDELLNSCNLVVTTTPSTSPILTAKPQPGTHITAVGSDTDSKNELAASILGTADIVTADSLPQCRERGEIHKALKAGTVQESQLTELGNIIAGTDMGRQSDTEVSIADLTGVAVQDMAIAKAVYQQLESSAMTMHSKQ